MLKWQRGWILRQVFSFSFFPHVPIWIKEQTVAMLHEFEKWHIGLNMLFSFEVLSECFWLLTAEKQFQTDLFSVCWLVTGSSFHLWFVGTLTLLILLAACLPVWGSSSCRFSSCLQVCYHRQCFLFTFLGTEGYFPQQWTRSPELLSD